MSEALSFIVHLLQQIPDGIGHVWFIGLLPVYLFFYILIGVLTLRFTGGSDLAWGIRLFRRRSVIDVLQLSLRRFYTTAGTFTALAVILPPFVVLNIRHDAILSALQENISLLCSMVIGLTTIVLTVSVVIILFHKNYYLVFSISDVLKSYHFTFFTGILLISCLVTCVCAMVEMYLTDGSIWWKITLLVMEWCILCCLVMTAGSFRIIYQVMFSNQKAELRLLNRLWRHFRGGERSDTSQVSRASDWEFSDVKTNIEYLCAEYVSAARTVPIHKVKRLDYLSGEARNRTWAELYNKIVTGFIYLALGVWLISMIVTSLALGEDGTGILLLNTILLAVVTIPAYFSYRHRSDRIQAIFDDTLGYELEMEDGKIIRVPRMKFTPANRYDKLVRKMNSITAFFCIALERGMLQEMTEASIGLVIDWLSDIKGKHSCLYLPVFASGYYAFIHGQRIEAVQKCYAALMNSRKHAEADAAALSGARPSAVVSASGTRKAGAATAFGARKVDTVFTSGAKHADEVSASGIQFAGAAPAPDAQSADAASVSDSRHASGRAAYQALIGSSPLPQVSERKPDVEKITGTDQETFDKMLLGHLNDLTRETAPAGSDPAASEAAYLVWLHECIQD